MTGMIHDEIAREIIHPISRESYHLAGELGIIGEDVELLDGILIRKMPKSPLHELVVRRILKLLTAALSASELDGFVAKEAPLAAEISEPEPDLAILSGDEEDYAECHPSTALLVIEVAVTSQELDNRKASIYASAGVDEYWIIDVPGGTVTTQLSPIPEAGIYQTRSVFSGEATVTSKTLPSFRIEMPAIVTPARDRDR